jgi:glutamyl-tRNA synthetase
MSAFAVAAPARRQLVLDPARTTLDARHEVLGGGRDEADLERATTPHARGAVAFEDALHPFAPAQLTLGIATADHSHQNGAVAGRFAPSPTGDLHLGNLRTALVAWLAARATGRGFLVRMEDLDRVTSSLEHERRQLADLAALGLDWDGDVVRQSDRFDRYRAEIERLRADGRVYECFCTRREIRAEIEAAASAPHAHLPDGAYPGTCRDLTDADRRARRADGRSPALRLRTDGEVLTVHDGLAGEFTGAVDDVVLARADGVPAYNLAVVVDDIAQGVTQVVRGDDLLSSTPRQILLYRLLGGAPPDYLHVPLVLGADGQRLAKRHGAVTLADLADDGWSTAEVVATLARSLGLASEGERVTTDVLLDRYDPALLPTRPTTLASLTG